MRLIDADELIYMTLGEDTEKPFRFVPTEFIEDAPTIDAVPVIRCKDCRFYAIEFPGANPHGICADAVIVKDCLTTSVAKQKGKKNERGSHGYIYSKIQEELCGQMHDIELNDLMKDVAKLAHDLEWYDSSDISEESYKKTVAEFKRKWFNAERDERLKAYIDEAVDKMRSEMYLLIGAERKEE